MSKVTCDIVVSVDGFAAVAERLHRWTFEEPEANAEVIEKITSAGACIMGRHMSGPDRGPAWDPDLH